MIGELCSCDLHGKQHCGKCQCCEEQPIKPGGNSVEGKNVGEEAVRKAELIVDAWECGRWGDGSFTTEYGYLVTVIAQALSDQESVIIKLNNEFIVATKMLMDRDSVISGLRKEVEALTQSNSRKFNAITDYQEQVKLDSKQLASRDALVEKLSEALEYVRWFGCDCGRRLKEVPPNHRKLCHWDQCYMLRVKEALSSPDLIKFMKEKENDKQANPG